MRVVLAQPRGFCAGVERAIEIVEKALEKYGPPIYVRHEIVHNRHVVERLRAKGAHFVDELDEIPPGSVTIFSAHGVSRAVEVAGLKVSDPTKLAFITQTTLSVDDTRAVIDALRERFPTIVGPDTKDICYATQNRQRAARELALAVDVVLVVGAANSSNSNRLREIAAEQGVRAHLIADADALDPKWLDGAQSVGITAGASAPAELVQQLIDRLNELGEVELSALPGITENVRFRMPPELADNVA